MLQNAIGGLGSLISLLTSPAPATEPSMKDKIKQLLLQMQQGGTDLFNRGSAAVGQAIQQL